MAFIRKSIDVVSPSDGQRYTSIAQYEKSLDSRGQHIMEDKTYRQLSEKLKDESRSEPKKPQEQYNHVHIDFANGRIEKSRKDLDV